MKIIRVLGDSEELQIGFEIPSSDSSVNFASDFEIIGKTERKGYPKGENILNWLEESRNLIGWFGPTSIYIGMQI